MRKTNTDLARLVFARGVAAVLAVVVFTGCSAESRKTNYEERAGRSFEAGKYDRAKIEYMNLLREEPESAIAIRRLGIIWLEEGAPLRAIPYLAKACQLEPDNLDSRMKLSLAYASIGQTPLARDEAKKILERSPAYGEALLFLADTASTEEAIQNVESRLEDLKGEENAMISLASGALALRKSDLESARKAVDRALELDPGSAAAHAASGRLLLARKEMDRAGEAFRKAADLAPLRSPERLRYAKFKAGMGQLDEARKILEELTAQVPDYLAAWRLLAQVAFTEKDYEGALASLENVFSRDAANYEARLLEAQVRLAKNEGKKALEILSRMQKTFPNAPLVHLQMARAYLLLGDPTRAEKSLREVLRLNPGNPDAVLLLANLELRRGEAERVVTEMTEFLNTYPENGSARALLADALRATGRLEEAAAVYRAQIAQDPRNARPHYFLGLILRQQDKLSEARDAFENARERAPDDVLSTSQLVDMDVTEKDFDSAHARVRAQLERTPDSPAAHFLEGRIYLAQNEWDQAEAELKKAIELKKDFLSAYNLLISLYLATNRLSDAAAELERVLVTSPRNISALMLSALVAEQLGEIAKVQDSYEKALEIQPDFGPALNNLAYLYAERLDRLDEARSLALKARALMPENAALADTLGWILFRRGDYRQAMALIQESVAELPENPEIQYHLGMTCYMMGRTDQARAAFEKSVASEADFPAKKEARERLAFLTEAAGVRNREAIEKMEAMLKERPEDPVLRLFLGEAYEEQERYEDAVASYEEAIGINPQLVTALARLAHLNAGPLRNKEKALGFAKEARRVSPADPEIAGLLGKLAWEQGDITWGYSLLQESLAKLPGNPEILNGFAWAAYSQGKTGEAREAMKRILETAPGSTWAADARTFLALTTSAPGENQRDPAAIETTARAVLERQPEHGPALMIRAQLETRQGEKAAAAATYESILSRYPDFTQAQKLLAALYVNDPKMLDRARALATSARKVMRSDVELARTLGEISFKKEEYAYAAQLLDECARAQALDAEGFYYLGISNLRLDRGAKAVQALKQAVSAGLGEPFLGEARKALAEAERE